MGDLLSKDFRAAPEQLFPADGFDPSAAGYAPAALGHRDMAAADISPRAAAT